jgi:copper transport protein
VVVGAALLVTPGLAGHPGTGDAAWFTTAIDVVHLSAAAVWAGGLAMLVTAVLPQSDETAVVRRFSAVAFVAVVVIVATGVLQSWRQVGSLDALQHTTYGNVLLAKVALFVGMVGLAAWSRKLLRRKAGESLRRSVAAEAAAAVGIVALTALLVNVVPGRSALAQPFSTTIEAGDLFVDVTVDPAKAGPVEMHVYVLAANGAVTDVVELTARLSLPAESIGPLRVPLERAAPGHYAAYRFDVPLAGRWRLDVVARTGDIDQVRGTTTVRIR